MKYYGNFFFLSLLRTLHFRVWIPRREKRKKLFNYAFHDTFNREWRAAIKFVSCLKVNSNRIWTVARVIMMQYRYASTYLLVYDWRKLFGLCRGGFYWKIYPVAARRRIYRIKCQPLFVVVVCCFFFFLSSISDVTMIWEAVAKNK